MKRVYWKDGTHLDVEDGVTWEYENDPDWLKTKNAVCIGKECEHNAVCGKNRPAGIDCPPEAYADSIVFSTDYPGHVDMDSDCCGFFQPKGGSLLCNECGMNINKAIDALRRDNGN